MKEPSQNLDAERAVLGAMLVTESAVAPVIEEVGLAPEDFYLDRHRTIFTCLSTAHGQGNPTDELSIVEALRRGNDLEAAGDHHYVSELAANVAAVGNAAYHAQIVRDCAADRAKVAIGLGLANGLGPAEAEEQLKALLAQSGARRSDEGAHAAPLAAIKRERIDWLWPGRVPLGMLTLLIGDPGLGKSLLTIDVAARLSRAGANSVILSAEDHAGATIRPRAEAADADLDRLHIAGMRRDGIEDGIALPDDAAELDRIVGETEARLVVVDPLMAHLPESVNSWRDQSVRRALAPLHRIAEERGCAVIVVAHLNKTKGADPLYRAGGSIGIPAAVRSALLLARDPEDSDGETGSARVLAHIKCNVAPQAESLACAIETVLLSGDEQLEAPRLRVTGTSETSASDLLDSPTGEERTERDEAGDFLRAELEEGPQAAKAVQRAAREAGISERTLRRAREALGVTVRREGFGEKGRWIWELPDDA